MDTVGFWILMLVVIMKRCMGEDCLPTPSSWKVSLTSYQEATVSISWHTGSVLCTNRVLISQATDKEETISPPIKVSKGKTMIKLWDKCKIYNFRLAVLLPGRSELVYSSSKQIWLPSMLTTISVLSNLAIINIPIDCPIPNMMVTACTSTTKTPCVSSPVSSYTETYLPGLLSCTMYTFSLDIHNTSIWNMQRITAANLQLSVSLSFTSGTLSTFYDDNCDISSSLWTVSICLIRDTGPGGGYYDDEDILDQDYEASGASTEVKNTCSLIPLQPGQPETEVRIGGLQPCTQYTFTMFTRHMVGDKRKEVKEEKVFTEMTHCSGAGSVSSEDALFFPSVTLDSSDSDQSISHLPSVFLTIIIITTLLLLIIISRKRHNFSLCDSCTRTHVRSEVENLL